MKPLRIEQHPFPVFVPPKMTVLLLGSFPGKEQTRGGLTNEAWFYGAPLNQFWRILEQVYQQPLKTKEAKQTLFKKAGIGITDVFRSVVRRSGSNLDDNLQVVENNRAEIERLLTAYRPTVLCTSRFVEKVFKAMFPGYPAVDVLPSPSPRYFTLTIEEKAAIYKKKLPGV